MKKKVLFVLSDYNIGGTTVSTRNLISVLDKDKYDVKLWVLHPNGILSWMYKGLDVIPTCFIASSLALNSWRDESGLLRQVAAAIVRKASSLKIVYRWMCHYAIKKCIGDSIFDTVVACQEGFLTSFVSNFNSSDLVAWVRCDYKRYYEEIKSCQKEQFYNKFKNIVCVAEKSRDGFVEIYPSLSDRSVCIYNPQDSNLILSQSEIDDHDDRFSRKAHIILSVGRLNNIKRFSKIPVIAKTLSERGLDFVWYIIGDGPEEQIIKDAIRFYDISDRVVLLGAKGNPHFYIKRADLFVCLSSSEACPRVINEAKILGTPVVSTDFPTVYEYLENGVNGLIAPLERVKDAIYEMLTNSQLYSNIKHEIKGFSFDNSELIKNLEKVL